MMRINNVYMYNWLNCFVQTYYEFCVLCRTSRNPVPSHLSALCIPTYQRNKPSISDEHLILETQLVSTDSSWGSCAVAENSAKCSVLPKARDIVSTEAVSKYHQLLSTVQSLVVRLSTVYSVTIRTLAI